MANETKRCIGWFVMTDTIAVRPTGRESLEQV